MFNITEIQKATEKAFQSFSLDKAKEQSQEFVLAAIDHGQLITDASIQTFNRMTGLTFTTYLDKVSETFQQVNENAKKVVKFEIDALSGYKK